MGPRNKYQYNAKELNEDFGLHWYDFGARWQDPAAGRCWQVDPLARNYVSYSPYQYTLNNPIRFIDPDGRMVMTHDDYVYLNTKGEEIGRIKDDKVQQVIIIADENLKKFDDLPYGRESIDDAANLGNTYDMKGVLAMYNRSAKDILPPVVDGTTYIDDGTGKPRYDVAAEHGNYLVKGNDGIVKVSSAPDIQGSHVGVILDKPSGNKLGTIHTHPNEDKKGIIRSTQTGAVIDPRHKGPSDTDLKQHPPQRGFHNIVVDNKHVYFYKGDQTTKVIKISKSKL
ncbi:MAG: hypothetical protein JNK77_01400 [Saprospiraceae bacterium]|nr:hypothetical protein [Saprospiraceae bacterium]